MQKLIDLNDGAMMSRGIFPSIGKNQKEIWRSASNVEFAQDRAKKATGFTHEIDSATIYAITQAFASGEKRAFWAEQSDLYVYQEGMKFHIGSGFSSLGYWSLETWGTWLIATNEIDPPKVWKDTFTPLVAAVDLGGLTGLRAGRKYRLMKKHKNHVLGYYGQTVEWCSESNPELWVPDINNSAGGLFIRDLDSDIIAACPLGPDYGVYSNDSLVIQRYTGEPFYFGFEKTIDGIGAVSDAAVVPVSNKNYGMSLKGFWVTDGISADYIDNPQINTWWKTYFYPPQARRTVGYHDEETNTVKWYFLGEGGIIYGVGFNITKGTWTILDQLVTAAAPKQVFSSALIGSRGSFGFALGHDAGSDPMASSLTTFALDAGDREMFKLWDMYRADFEGSGLEVRFGFQDHLKDTTEWTAWAPLVEENYIDRESPFLTIDLRSTEASVDWALTGFSVHGEKTGYI